MRPTRRAVLAGGVAIATTGLVSAPVFPQTTGTSKIRALAFDAFPVFDPRPIFARAEELFPGNGEALSAAWRTRQFKYTWLRALSHTYVDFWKVTEDALVFAAELLKIEMNAAQRDQLMQGYLELKAWPDALAALDELRGAGLKLAFLSNFTPKMLNSAIANANMGGRFAHVLSTDTVQSYKPDPRTYQLGIDAFGLTRDEILFVAFAGWDAAGAKAFGYPTYWVNRLRLPAEALGQNSDGTGTTLTDLVSYVRARNGQSSL